MSIARARGKTAFLPRETHNLMFLSPLSVRQIIHGSVHDFLQSPHGAT